jgi:hypothetical protein
MSARFRRVVASCAILIFVGTLALPLGSETHLSWNDDADCALMTEGGGHHSPSAIQAEKQTESSGHCPLCHWLRAFSGVSLTLPESSTPAFDTRNAISRPALLWDGRIAALDRPSRAPPQPIV